MGPKGVKIIPGGALRDSTGSSGHRPCLRVPYDPGCVSGDRTLGSSSEQAFFFFFRNEINHSYYTKLVGKETAKGI